MNDLQKSAAQAIVNVFETGRPHGDYGRVTLLAGDSGHLTYGRSQTTLASGNLFLLLRSYCDAAGAANAAALRGFLNRVASRDLSLDHDVAFRALLTTAGEDIVMHDVQDKFFDRVYWQPAVAEAVSNDVTEALGVGVIYDGMIHGSWRKMRDRTTARHGSPQALGERTWIERYVETRRAWLETHSNTLLRRTVYRMESFGVLITARNWVLALPFRVRGVEISEEILSARQPVRVSAEDRADRVLRVEPRLMKGRDVEAVQNALVRAGFRVAVDGAYGEKTAAAVKRFQKARRLKSDGIVGPVTRAALGL